MLCTLIALGCCEIENYHDLRFSLSVLFSNFVLFKFRYAKFILVTNSPSAGILQECVIRKALSVTKESGTVSEAHNIAHLCSGYLSTSILPLFALGKEYHTFIYKRSKVGCIKVKGPFFIFIIF